jgi:hypothetical protein
MMSRARLKTNRAREVAYTRLEAAPAEDGVVIC